MFGTGLLAAVPLYIFLQLPDSEELWAAFQSKVDKDLLRPIRYSDIPFPSMPLAFPASVYRDPQRRRDMVRTLQMRWHPDKFLQAFGASLDPVDDARIMTRVKEVSQAINSIS